MRLLRALVPFAPFAVILAGAALVAAHLGAVPATLTGLKLYGADALLAVGALVALAFQRGRALLALLILAIAYAGLKGLASDVAASFTARTVYGAACIAVPLNLGVLSWLRERGIANAYGARRGVALLAQVVLIALVVSSRRAEVTGWLYLRYVHAAWLPRTPVPQLALALIALAMTSSLAAWIVKRSPIDLALGAANAAFGIAAHGFASRDYFALFIAAAALIMTVAVLQDGLRMAFRDELTGLRSRRALNERLAGLGRRYAIAMLDVDHFKRVNDLHGHDTGDQVLRFIASRLARLGGGCTAYRYGGEEFALVFPGRSAEEALPYLEALREEIAGYALGIRRNDRPRSKRAAQRRRGTGQPARSLTVTVSIGLTERTAEQATADAVMSAADRALYRAKRAGRNRVVQ
jgi:diguanylate cyclase (GGDEF)-like protein